MGDTVQEKGAQETSSGEREEEVAMRPAFAAAMDTGARYEINSRYLFRHREEGKR